VGEPLSRLRNKERVMASLGTFRFLSDHVVNGSFIHAGEIREMFDPWTPTSDVEPLDATSTASFYAQGPNMGALFRTQFSPMYIDIIKTYWRQIPPSDWVLTGLGAGYPPITKSKVGRVK
jgi:hypothetical protein